MRSRLRRYDGQGACPPVTRDRWYGAEGGLAPVESAIPREAVAHTGSSGLGFGDG
jgi:hypothetical protein